jgi:hypothetical protein
MSKKSKSQAGEASLSSAGSSLPFLGAKASVDPTLASLFDKSVRILTFISPPMILARRLDFNQLN